MNIFRDKWSLWTF